MRHQLVLFLVAGMSAATPVSAQKVDMGTIKCEEFLKAPTEFHGQVLMWLTGYMADEDADPVIDFDKMAENGKRLGAYCAQNPASGLMTAAEKAIK
jgi:acid stress chaperone HdeB